MMPQILICLARLYLRGETSGRWTSRYVLNGDEVYDKKTDLTWERCSVGKKCDERVSCVQGFKENCPRTGQCRVDEWMADADRR